MLPFKTLDIFSGIGGCSLGLEATCYFKTIGFCETDVKCQRVLNKLWPGVKVFSDIKQLTKRKLIRNGITEIDVIVGGFPCQDISTAGTGKGISGQRSGLWREYARLIGEIRPRYAIVENVAALRYKGKGLYRVLADLAEIGYDAEWHCIPASAVGAPHRRDRIWIIAYPGYNTRSAVREFECEASTEELTGLRKSGVVSNTRSPKSRRVSGCEREKVSPARSSGKNVPNTDKQHGDNGRFGASAICGERSKETKIQQYADWWKTEPDVGRVVNGFPGRVDRLKQLGNAVVPQIPYLIGISLIKKYILYGD